MIRATATYVPRSDIGQFIAVHITPAVRMGVEEVASKTADRMRELCPVDTGRLRDSITPTAGGKPDIQELERTIRAEVGPHTEYSEFVEYGTGIRGAESPGAGEDITYSSTWPGMPAQPFVRPALDEMRTQALDIFANNLRTELGR